MAKNEKITVSFETDLDNPVANDGKILMSGPLAVYATVDRLDELNDPSLLESVRSDYETYHSIVVFVKNITNATETTQRTRGAFFVYQGEKDGNPLWQEILLGTHTHSNISVLDKISEAVAGLDFDNLDSEKLIIVNQDGSIRLDDKSAIRGLPELPFEIQEAIKKASGEKYGYLQEPVDSEEHHLDAVNYDTYDWLDPSHTSVSNCRELYRRLIKANRPLYLSKFIPGAQEDVILNLEVYPINYKDSTISNTLKAKEVKGKLLVALDLPFKYEENDMLFLFDNDTIIKRFTISKVEEDRRTVNILLDKEDFNYDETRRLTVLKISSTDENLNVGIREEINRYFTDGTLDLYSINEELLKLYVEDEFVRRPAVPQLFLTTDESGNPVWNNKILPAQTFYAATKYIDNTYLEKEGNVVELNGKEFVKVVFKEVYYKIREDFPLLVVNDFVAFNVTPDVSSGEDIVYYLPKDGDNAQYDFELSDNEEVKVTLLVVRNTSKESVADELARNYVSKKDAVSILSHGTIKLDDYVTKAELIQYAKAQHSHSQYALKEHDHDWRYANYYHTHPEMYALMAELAGGETTAEDIEEWVNDISAKSSEAARAVLESLGLEYSNGYWSFDDKNIRISSEVVEAVNAKAAEVHLEPLESERLFDVLDYLVKFFELDTIEADQVLLKRAIPVKLVNGAIGGLEEEKLYEKGTHLQDILEDILNPYAGVEKIREILTPTSFEIKWYKKVLDTYTEVQPMHLEYDENTAVLCFKIKAFNKFGKECIYESVHPDDLRDMTQRISLIIHKDNSNEDLVELNDDGYYVYDNEFDFASLHYIPNLKITWKATRSKNGQDDIIYDNYGEEYNTLNTEDTEPFIYECTFYIDLPDFYIGSVPVLDPENPDIDYNLLTPCFASTGYKGTLTTDKPFVVLYEVSDVSKIEIFDDDLHQFINNFLEDFPAPAGYYVRDFMIHGRRYIGKYYDFLDPNETISLRVRVNR